MQPLPLTILLVFALAHTINAAEINAPHILVILADDLGYGDVQCNNLERGNIPTPNIDRLAAQGMRFTDGHSSSGVCSPSRYSLLTGRFHWRTRLQSGIVGVFGEPLIAPDRMTIGTLAKQHGYRTAAIGKWHLGWNWSLTKEQRELLQVSKQAGQDDEADPQRATAVATAKQQEFWSRRFSKISRASAKRWHSTTPASAASMSRSGWCSRS